MIRETYLPGSRTVESLKCRCDYKNNKLYFTGKGQQQGFFSKFFKFDPSKNLSSSKNKFDATDLLRKGSLRVLWSWLPYKQKVPFSFSFAS